MGPLELDYLRSGARSRLALLALAAFAVAFTADTALHYRSLVREVTAKELRVARVAAARPHIAQKADAPTVTSDEIASARDIARRLSIPWNSLFLALEAAKTDGVALLAVDPDAENRAVMLSAEAKDYAAVLAFIGNLDQQPALDRVYLSHHEQKRGGSHAVAFSVSAAWKGER